MCRHFVPFWASEDRWFYTNISSDWKRATAYAMGEKWDAAANIWQSLFDSTTNKKRKAHLASNLALWYEIAGNFAKAIEHAATAFSIFQEITNEDDQQYQKQKIYLELLIKRLENDHKLSEQLGEKF